ncbi:MAG: phytanoyl-CoA dioxygenase [Bacteroidota bacterium]|nr:MAG: phytanoyl-CoA dioxygenase [Bacteroidota bacterium]
MSNEEVQKFIHEGFVRIDNAFSREMAEEARKILWRDTGCDPNDRSTWTRPVVRLGGYSDPPFRDAANTPVLREAFDRLVGKGRWLPRGGLGTFPVRFPSDNDPGDTGWHVDASFPGGDPNDFMSYRVNVESKGRALLMLFLFSDTSERDAPTRIRVGSHFEVARILEPAGAEGLGFMEIAGQLDRTSHCPEVLAIGEAGTVYLCHPFLVHAAQPHRGSEPKFMAQPPLIPKEEMKLHREAGDYSPVEEAIRIAIGLAS